MQQGAGAPLAGRDLHPGVPHRDVDTSHLLERLERLRADPRAVRADLEDVAEPGADRTAHPLPVQVRAGGRAPVLQPENAAAVPADRDVPGLDQRVVQPDLAPRIAADQVRLVGAGQRRAEGAARRRGPRPGGAVRHLDRDEVAHPVGEPEHIALRLSAPCGTAAPRTMTCPRPRAASDSTAQPSPDGTTRACTGARNGSGDHHVGFGGGADGGARGRQAQRSAVPAPGELEPQRSWRLRGRRLRGDCDRLGQRHRLRQRQRLETAARLAAETDPVPRPQPGAAPPAAPNVAHIPPPTVLPSPGAEHYRNAEGVISGSPRYPRAGETVVVGDGVRQHHRRRRQQRHRLLVRERDRQFARRVRVQRRRVVRSLHPRVRRAQLMPGELRRRRRRTRTGPAPCASAVFSCAEPGQQHLLLGRGHPVLPAGSGSTTRTASSTR